MCTTGHTCTAPGANVTLTREMFVNDVGGCAGTCRKFVSGKCPGSSTCLDAMEPCSGPPPPPPPPPPPAGGPEGPDVSSYQGAIDWPKVRSEGNAGFAMAKATEGLTYTDSTFVTNWKGMKAAGIPIRGAYHFAHVPESATAQADHFTKAVGKIGTGEFVTLDIEVTTTRLVAAGNWTETTQAAVATWCVDWAERVMINLGIGPNKVMVYTGAYFWNDNAGGSSAMAVHPLWVAGYTSSPPTTKGWGSWTFWQFTDKHTCPGFKAPVDYSKYHGTQSQLEALVG